MKIGVYNMNVSEFMTNDVITCTQDQTVSDAAALMEEKNISAVPVVDNDNKLVGMVTESDFVGKETEVSHALASIKQLFGQTFNLGSIEEIYKKVKNKPLSEVMSTEVLTITPDTTLNKVVNLMIEKNLKRFPVVKDEEIVGIITRKNLLYAFNKVN